MTIMLVDSVTTETISCQTPNMAGRGAHIKLRPAGPPRLPIALLAAAAAAMAGCAGAPSPPPSIPDPGRIAALEQMPQVSLRGPDNPTLDPAVLSEFWDSARVRGAAPVQATPRAGLQPPP